ncbi:MAG: BACON domain-containing protein, partial [bacterium]|nr:BACON domain-containing protein [bacterium]
MKFKQRNLFVFLFVFLLVLNISGASFSTADLGGTWTYHSLSMDSITDMDVAYGTIVIDSSGQVTGGTYNSLDGGSGSITGGVMSLSSDGILSGNVIDSAGNDSVFYGGKMNDAKTLCNFVTTTTTVETFSDFGIFCRTGGSFSTSDISGTWHIDAIIGGVGDSGTGVLAAYGTLGIDSSGNLTSAAINLSDGSTAAYDSGSFALTADGTLTGSITTSDQSSTLTIVNGKLDRNKNTCLLTATSDWGNGLEYLGSMSKTGGTFTQADLSGNWYLCSPTRDSWTGSGQWWRHGSITVDSEGTVSGGPIATSQNTSLTNISGTLNLNGSGVVSGSFTFDGQATLPVVDGKMDQSKAVIHALQFDDNRGGYLYLVKESPSEGTIQLNRSQLNYGSADGVTTEGQVINISCSGGTVNWNATTDQSWCTVSQASGTGAGTVTVTVDVSGLAPGEYTGTVTLAGSDTSATTAVYLTVYGAGSSSEPFGQYATPAEGAELSSSVPFTGWVLDDIGISEVGLYLGSGGALTFIGNAVFVEGARPDIQQAYPRTPQNSTAGWGYMMLTHFLPGGGNGSYTIHAIATDLEGKQTTLGTRTVTINNDAATKPFGAI